MCDDDRQRSAVTASPLYRNDSGRPLNRRLVLKAAGISALALGAASAPAADAGTQEPPNPGIIIGERVRVRTDDGADLNRRQSAGTSAAIVGTIPNGQTAKVIGGPVVASDGTWYQLQTPNATGWATARYLVVEFKAGDTVKTTDAVNLRSSASTSASVIAVGPPGTTGTVVGGRQTGSGYTWWQIKTSSGTGWAIQDLLTMTATPPPSPPPLGARRARLALPRRLHHRRRPPRLAGGGWQSDGGAAGRYATARTFQLGITNGKLETNRTLAAGEAQIKLATNPISPNKTTYTAAFRNVWNAAATGLTNTLGVSSTPSSDYESLALDECDLSVTGVPSWIRENSMVQTSRHTRSTVVPMSVESGVTPAVSRQVLEIVGDLNRLGSTYYQGRRTATITNANVATDLANTPVFPGDLFVDPAKLGSGHPVISLVTANGVLGTLSGITATGTMGQSSVRVNDITPFRLGQKIYIVGVSGQKQILGIHASTNSLALGGDGLSASVTNAAVSWVPPAFRRGQIEPITGSKNWTPAAGQATGTLRVQVFSQ